MRLIATLLLGAFLTLVGMQSVHAHDSAAGPVDSCAVCTLAHQAQRQAPAAAPVVRSTPVRLSVVVVLPALPGAAPVRAAGARAPPSAS